MEVGKNVVLGDTAAAEVGHAALSAGALPRTLEVPCEVEGDVAGGLFHLVDDVGLVAHVVVSEGEDAGQVVGEELATDIEPSDGGMEGPALEDGGDGGVGVSAVDEQDKLGGRSSWLGGWRGGWLAVWGREHGLNIVIGVEGGAGSSVVAREAKLLKDHLVTVGLQDGQRVGGLGEQQTSLGGIAWLGRVRVEELAFPDVLLGLPVHDEALLDGATEDSLAEVGALGELGGDVRLAVAIAGDAVRDDAWFVDGATVVGHEACLDRVGSVVYHECSRGWRRSVNLGLSRGRHQKERLVEGEKFEVSSRAIKAQGAGTWYRYFLGNIAGASAYLKDFKVLQWFPF